MPRKTSKAPARKRKSPARRSRRPARAAAKPAAKRRRPRPRAAPRRAGKVELVAGPNRLSRALEGVALANSRAVDAIVRATPYHAVDLAPTYRRLYARHRTQAARLAESYARSIPDALHHRELFQQAAVMTREERRTLIAGYR